jgi:hypothetical protein
VQRVLVTDARNRLLLKEVSRVFVRQSVRFPGGLFDHRALEKALGIELLPLELAGGEAESRHAIGLGEERRQAALDPVLGDEGAERRRFRRSDEPRAIRSGGEKRRRGRLRELVEPFRQHSGEQPLDQALPVGADGRLVALRHFGQYADDGPVRLGVGRDGVQRSRVLRHRERRLRARIDPGGNGGEARSDPRFHRRGIEVAHGNDRHHVGTIPIGVELPQHIGRERADDLGGADRQPLGVARSLEQHR